MGNLFSLRQQGPRANATLEYWQDASKEEDGRPNLSSETSVIVLSEHGVIDLTSRTKKPRCTCNENLALITKCRSYKCAKREKLCVAIGCGCRGRCGHLAGETVIPLPAPP